MIIFHQMVEQLKDYFDGREYKLAIVQAKKIIKFIKKIRRKTK